MLWENKENKLFKSFVFKDFNESMVFVNKIALIAEQIQHHPTIFIHFNKVHIEIYTFEKNAGITSKDFYLSNLIDNII